MVKKITAILLLAVLTAPLLTACSPHKETPPENTNGTYADYMGTNKTIAALLGDVYGELARDKFKAKNVLEFVLAPDIMEAVRTGKADAGIIDDAFVNQIKNSGLYPDFDYLPVPEELFVNRASHVFYTRELRDKYNVWLNIITKDGTFDEMYARWIGGSLPREEDIPRFELSGKNGTLKVVNTGNFPPFSYIDSNNEQVGFDAEMINRFAGYLGMNIEYAIMSYDGIVPYIASGRADMSACSFTVTDERSDALLFGAEFTKARAALIVPKSAAGQMTQKPRDYTDFAGKKIGGFTEWLKTGIERNLITDNRWKMVVNGLGVTMIIALFAQFFGTVFGSFVCWLLLRKNRFVSGVGKFYCGLIYRLPAVALLMVAYYVIFGDTTISNVIVAIVTFTMITGVDVALSLKGTIETVDSVEIEAARSLGFSAFKAFLTVTLPQAVRRALPGYANGFIGLFKLTAIVGFIAIQDLMRAGDIIRGRTYDAYFPLLFVSLIYLIVTTICVQLFKFIVKKVNGGVSL